MSSQTQQQDNRERVRLVLDTKDILPKELEEFFSETNGLWAQVKEGSDMWICSVPVLAHESLCPTIIHNVREAISGIDDRINKKISFEANHKGQDYIFGINEFNKHGETIKTNDLNVWRVKKSAGGGTGGGSGGYSKNKGMSPMPLAELYFGPIADCNEKLKDESQKWYLADQKIETQPDGRVYAYAILKRNRWVPLPNKED